MYLIRAIERNKPDLHIIDMSLNVPRKFLRGFIIVQSEASFISSQENPRLLGNRDQLLQVMRLVPIYKPGVVVPQ